MYFFIYFVLENCNWDTEGLNELVPWKKVLYEVCWLRDGFDETHGDQTVVTPETNSKLEEKFFFFSVYEFTSKYTLERPKETLRESNEWLRSVGLKG